MRVRSLMDLPPGVRPSAEAQLAAMPKRPKYGNVKTEAHGLKFDSKWEAQRYEELLRMERIDLIRDLAVQQSFALHVPTPSGQLARIAAYVADFTYWRDGKMTVEDAKSIATRRKEAYRLKARMFEAEYGVRISEVERSKPRSGV